jgi:hypothetical protein
MRTIEDEETFEEKRKVFNGFYNASRFAFLL